MRSGIVSSLLQICYWYQGEGFGEVYTPEVLEPFLDCDTEIIATALQELQERGYLKPIGESHGYCFTQKGKQEGGRMFADSFSDFQKSAHGECAAGCCDGDDHSKCGDDCSLH